MKPPRKRSSAVLLVVLTLVAGACGTRSDTGDNASATPQNQGSGSDATVAAPADANAGPGGTAGAEVPEASTNPKDPSPSQPQTRQSPGSATRATSEVPLPGAQGAGPAGSPPRAAAGSGGGGGGSGVGTPGAPPGTPQGPETPDPGVATRSPALIATVGTYSGPLGGVFFPGVGAVQAWLAFINQKGGVNGHPVKLLVYDDGGDPARHRSQVQEAVERHHVIAFVYNAETVGGRPSVDYIMSKRVPVIGNESGGPWFYDYAMYFPQGSVVPYVIDAAIFALAGQAVPAGKTKLATVVCAEVRECGDVPDKAWSELAPGLGFQHVYRAKSSVAQPDYTAECLAARNAGAELFLIALDSNSVQRLAQACARQGYRPQFNTISSVATDRLKDDPNLDGMVSNSSVFPYFQSGTPASDEYQQVMRTFGREIAPGVAPAMGWVAAKLFEKAAANLPEPPTAEGVLRGLWGLRDETLGGLTHPLTFTENKTAPRKTCWFTITIKNKTWVSPDRFTMQCRK